MNFTTPEFLVFLPIVLVVYTLVFHKERLRDVVLLVASYAFYMSWNWHYAGLIALSTLVDYAMGLGLARAKRPGPRRAMLVTSLVVNLGLLAVFKYFNFFLDSAGTVSGWLGLAWDPPVLRVLLPVGISFYTFQTLSYTIDLYRQRIPVERDLLKFALFVSFFPQLVAGPIVRASQFLPQLHRTPRVTTRRFHSGLLLVFRGLVKKVLLADLLAMLAVDAVFANPGSFSTLDLTLALYGYAFQIYNDFSGYSDIAIGVGRMLGFDLPKNFNRPYQARNVREFWTRWHISLSTWLRDYLYIPLGGGRGKPSRVRRNLMITMLLGGLWHGAGITFVLWGAYHGLLLVFARGAARHGGPPATWRRVAWERFACFHLVLAGWLLFRIQSGSDLLIYLEGIARLDFGSQLHPVYVLVLVAAVAAHHVSQVRLVNWSRRFIALPLPVQAFAYACLLFALTGFSVGGPSFIYFQF